MNDQIPADKVRKIATAMRDAMRRVEDDYPDGEFLMDMSDYIRDLDALLPVPPRPTLADMTPDKRAACQWMQCEVRGERRIITLVSDDDNHSDAVTLAPSGYFYLCSLEIVTPRPDLPRLEWPGTEKQPAEAPAPALPGRWRLADHRDYGRIIVTTTPDPNGRIYFVFPDDDDTMGYGWHFCDPDDLTFLDQGAADAVD